MPTFTGTPNDQAIIDNGTPNWISPGNATGAADGSTADCLNLTNESNTDNLELSNFGFAIPGGQTIVGIEVILRGRHDVLLNAGEFRVMVNKTKAGGGGEGEG